VLNGTAAAPAVLTAAGLAAARLGLASIEVVHVRPPADPSFMPSEEAMTPARAAAFAADVAAQTAALRAVVAAWQAAAPGMTAAWREIAGAERKTVAGESRGAALTVLGAPPDAPAEAITATLFDAAATVLLVPPAVPASLGAHVAVAWKPGAAAERAVEAALPFLRAAARRTVLVGNEAGGAPALPAALSGIGAADLRTFDAAVPDLGAAIQRVALEAGADLLVTGAYSHTRMFERILGGATREILHGVMLPVLMRH
jgi:nucleotide-binding universal stress UspA family protein